MNGFPQYLSAWRRRRSAVAALLALALLAAWAPARAQDLLEAGQAFRFEARMAGPETLEVTWRIADDHYMYQHAFSVSAPDGGVVLGEPDFPEGKKTHDQFFGEVVTYESDVSFMVPVTPIADGLTRFTIEAVGQGCNEPVGVCYPPLTETATIELAVDQSSAPQTLMGGAGSGNAASVLPGGQSGQSGQSEFLHPDEAFQFQLTPMSHDTVLTRFTIAPGYYLYKDKLGVESEDAAVEVVNIQLPEGTTKTDQYFGESVVFYQGVDAQVTLARRSTEAGTVSFKLSYQGCADDGICYPPVEKTVSLRLPGVGEAVAAPDPGAAASGGSGF